MNKEELIEVNYTIYWAVKIILVMQLFTIYYITKNIFWLISSVVIFIMLEIVLKKSKEKELKQCKK